MLLVTDLTLSQMTSRFLGSLVLICCLAGMLAACGAATPVAVPSPGGPESTVTAPIELPVIVSMAGRFDREQLAILDQQIAAFEETNPDIRVELIEIKRNPAEYHDELASLLAQRDTRIDVLLLDNAQLARFSGHDWLMSLDDYAQLHGIDASSFVPASIQASTFEGSLVALPWTAHTGLLYFRQDLLKEHGRQPPGSWPDLQHDALQIMAGEDLGHGYVWQGAAYGSLTANTLEIASAYGAEVVDKHGNAVSDSTEMRAALELMASLVSSGASPEDVYTFSERDSSEAFKSGDAVMMRGWTSAWTDLTGADSPVAGRVGVAPLPSSVLYGQGIALSAFSMHPSQAFRLMNFLSAHDRQVQRARDAGQAPTLNSAYEDAELLSDQPVLESLYLALSDAGLPPRTEYYDELSEVIYSEVNKLLKGQQDVETTAANIQHRLEALLQ
jgi:ABC-type glycerol-3-phosphate transport system substrate-binding protein